VSAELSIVILSWNTRSLLQACLRSLLDQDHGVSLQIIVVDNASADGSADLVEAEFPGVQLRRNTRNEGYARGNNLGAEWAEAPLVLYLNSDTEVFPGALQSLVGFLHEHPNYGAVAPRLRSSDGSVQRSCMRFPNLRVALLYDSLLDRLLGKTQLIRDYFMEDFDHLSSRDVDQPPGAAFLVRREVLDQIGGFDEDLFLFFNDVDFCQRIAAAGYRIRYVAEAVVLHHVGRSTSQFKNFVSEWNINRVRYYRKHHGWIGCAVVKLAVFLRGLEEMSKVISRAPRGEKLLGIRDVRQVVARTLRA
jgi:hypothetical protein